VGVIMGSSNDWETLRYAAETLTELQVAHEVRVVSAHRTPDLMFEYAASAEARGIAVIIAGAGGAAHLPGMVAAKTLLPVLGVPVQSQALSGMDSLLSIAQMPAGVPVGTLAIGKAGPSMRPSWERQSWLASTRKFVKRFKPSGRRARKPSSINLIRGPKRPGRPS